MGKQAAQSAETQKGVFDEFGGDPTDFEDMDYEEDAGAPDNENLDSVYDDSDGEVETNIPLESVSDDEADDEPNDKPSDDPDEKEDPEPGAADQGKSKKDNLNERFRKLTSQRDDAEARADKLELELARLRNEKKQPKPQENKLDEEPDPADYDDYDEYLDDLEAFNKGLDEADQKAAKPDEGQRDQPQGIVEEFTLAKKQLDRKLERWEDKPADFQEKVYGDVQITQSMVIAVNEMENPGEALYALASNPAKAAQIAASAPAMPDFTGLTPSQITRVVKDLTKQAQAIADLVKGGGSKEPEPKANQRKLKSNAPAPINPTSGDASAGAEKDVNDMSFSELDEHMRKEDNRFW